LAEISASLRELEHRRELLQQRQAAGDPRAVARTVVSRLRTEVNETEAALDGLRAEMAELAVLEQAKGMLMVRLDVDEQAASEYLRSACRHLDRPPPEVAAEIVAGRAGGVV
jgi:AmiR/NasT family two-component response regulator